MAVKKLEEGQLILCTVRKIAGTIVFVHIDDYNTEGTLTFAEIFPGKIRNIRDFVFPGKKIVCKVLNIKPQVIEVSLRRVKVNERNEFNEKAKKERNYKAMLKTVLGEQEAEKATSEIKDKEESLVDFLESAKENPETLLKYIQKEKADKIIAILREKRAKETVISKKFSLQSKMPDGMKKVKETINSATSACKGCEVSYISAGKYRMKLKAADPKQADQQLRNAIEKMEDLAKKNGCTFSEEKD